MEEFYILCEGILYVKEFYILCEEILCVKEFCVKEFYILYEEILCVKEFYKSYIFFQKNHCSIWMNTLL